MKPEKLSKEVVALLEPRIGDELTAFYFYRAADNWCNDKGYFIASKFFKGESASELEHAKKIEDYIVGWDVLPNLPIINKPKIEFKNLLDVLEQAYNMEFDLYEKYETTSNEILALKDICAFDLLQFHRTQQKDAVAEYSDKLNTLDGTNTDSKFEMLTLEETLFE